MQPRFPLTCWLLASLLMLGACASPPPPATPVAAASAPEPEADLRAFSEDSLYELLVGEVAGHRQQYDLALRNYMHQARTTGDLAVTRRAARLAKYLNRAEEAREAAELWLQLEPDSIEALDLLALSLRELGRPVEAFDQLLKIKRLGLETDFGRIAAGTLDMPSRVSLELLQRFDAALQDTPRDVDLLVGKSIVQQRFNPDGALETVRLARKYATPEQRPRVTGIEATILQHSGRTSEALALLQEATEQQPTHRALNLQYARLLAQQDLAKAKARLAELHERYPYDSEITWLLALVDYELKLFTDAKGLMQELLEDSRYVDRANFYLGEIALVEGDREQALFHYQQVGPGEEFNNALIKLARMYIADGQLDRFDAHLETLRDAYPDEATALYLFESDLLGKLGQTQAASDLLDKAIAEHPDDTNLRYVRSLSRENAGDIAGAEADLRHILQVDPDNSAALNALGYLLTVHTDRYAEAKLLIQQALALRPNDAATLDSLGWVLFKLGETDEALVYLEAAYKLDQDPEIAAHLGEVLWLLGRQADAIAVWQQALAADPGNSHVLEVVERLNVDLAAAAAGAVDAP